MNVIYENRFVSNISGVEHYAEFYVVKITDLILESKTLVLDMREKTWLNNFPNKMIRESYELRAQKTAEDFASKVNKGLLGNDLKKLLHIIGEKAVTLNANKVIDEKKKYKRLALPELWKIKKEGNPGFDYYNENDIEYFIVFGEGKFKNDQRPYNDALEQIVEFIDSKHDKEEIAELVPFVNQTSIDNFDKRIFSAGFSIPSNTTLTYDQLWENIKNNKYFNEIIKKFDLIVVGVEM